MHISHWCFRLTNHGANGFIYQCFMNYSSPPLVAHLMYCCSSSSAAPASPHTIPATTSSPPPPMQAATYQIIVKPWLFIAPCIIIILFLCFIDTQTFNVARATMNIIQPQFQRHNHYKYVSNRVSIWTMMADTVWCDMRLVEDVSS